jgi:cation transport ATPase
MAVARALRLQIGGMDCGACAEKIENAMQRLAGVSEVAVSYSQASLSLTLNEDRTSRATIEARIRRSVSPQPTRWERQRRPRWSRTDGDERLVVDAERATGHRYRRLAGGRCRCLPCRASVVALVI